MTMWPTRDKVVVTFAVAMGTYEIVVRGLMDQGPHVSVLTLVSTLLLAPYASALDRRRQRDREDADS